MTGERVLARSIRGRRLAVVDILILVGAATLIYYRKVTDTGILTRGSFGYRSDFVFLVVVLIALVGGLMRLAVRPTIHMTRVEKAIYLSLGFSLVSSVFATLASALTEGIWFDATGLVNAGKMFVGVGLFVVVYLRLRRSPGLDHRLAALLYLPPLIPASLGLFMLVSPFRFDQYFGGIVLLSGGARFQGLSSNPWQATMSSLVGLSFFIPFTIFHARRSRWFRLVIDMVCVFALVATAFWSMNRSVFVTLAVVLGVTVVGTLVRLRPGPAFVVLTVITTITTTAFVWEMLPTEITEAFRSRFSVEVDRFEIWRYYVDVAITHPLGVGFNYEQAYYFDSLHQGRVNAQNNILAAWMYGGVIAVASLVFLLIQVGRIVIAEFHRPAGDPRAFLYYIGAVTGYVSIWVQSVFVGLPLAEFLHSLLLAMVLRGTPSSASALGSQPLKAHPR